MLHAMKKTEEDGLCCQRAAIAHACLISQLPPPIPGVHENQHCSRQFPGFSFVPLAFDSFLFHSIASEFRDSIRFAFSLTRGYPIPSPGSQQPIWNPSHPAIRIHPPSGRLGCDIKPRVCVHVCYSHRRCRLKQLRYLPLV